jgi:hypothetical protein
MKFLLQILATVLVVSLIQYFFPWWVLAIGCMAVGYFFATPGWQSFFAGLLGVALVWGGLAYWIDQSTQSALTERVARLFPTQTVPLLMLVTALVGGLVGGFASLTGSLISYKKKRRW